MSFECARRGKKKVFACCNVQNEVRRPSMTDSGGQDGVSGGQIRAKRGPKGGSNHPILGAKTEGVQNQRTKAPKERVQISRKSSSSRGRSQKCVFRSCGVWPPEGLAQQVRENVKICSPLVQEALFWLRRAKLLGSNAFFGGTGGENEPKSALRKGSREGF